MKKYKLGEIVTVLAGGTPSTKIDKYWSGSIPWLSVKDFCSVNKWVSSTEKTITQEGFDNCPSSMLKKGDLILSARGTVGKIAMVDKNMAFNQSCFGLRAKKDFVTSDFLFYWFLNNQQIFKGAQQGNVFKSITLDFFEKTNAIIPPLQTQQKIAAVLSSLDDKIALNKKINAKLEAMAKRLYDYWFVQFDYPDKNGKPYKTSGGKMVWNEVLKREIPEGWEVGALSDIANITMGQSPEGSSYNENGRGTIFYQGSTDFGIKFPTVRMFTTEPARFAQKGDILMSVRAPVGAMNIANTDCCIGRGLSAMNSKIGSITYLYYIMDYFRHTFENKNGAGTTFGSITKDELFELPVVIPDSNILKQFEFVVKPIFDKQMNIGFEIQKLTNLRDRLLPLLMNGQVEVEG